MKRVAPQHAGIVSPISTSQNYTFRSRLLTSGEGTSPSITIHKFGTLQYQGKPESANIVARCFKDCIYKAMESHSSSIFINSHAVTRDIKHDSIDMS